MASSASSKWIVSVQALLISAGIFSIAMAFKVYVIPLSSASHLPIIVCHSVIGWLKPPYLYLIVNGIIITIAAFSRFQFDYQNRPVIPSPPSLANPEYPVGGGEGFDDKWMLTEDDHKGGCWVTDQGSSEDGDGVGQKPKVSRKIPVKELTEIWPESLSPNVNTHPTSTTFVHRRSVSGSSNGTNTTYSLHPHFMYIYILKKCRISISYE